MATLTIHPDYRALLAAAGLDTFDALFEAAEGRALDGHTARSVSRIEIGDDPDHRVGIYVKRFWGRAAKPQWHYLLRLERPTTAARREWINARQLLDAGVAVARPVACGRDPDGDGARALVAFREVEGPSLAAWLANQPTGAVAGRDARVRHAIAQALGREAARLHAAAFSYPDFYAKHVYIEGAATPNPRVVLIDVHRLRMGLPWRRPRDLAALDVSTRQAGVGWTDRLRVLRAYLGGSPTSGRARHLIARIARKAARMPNRGQDPNLIVSRRVAPPGVVPFAEERFSDIDGGRLRINEAFRPMLESAGLATLDALMAVDGGEVYREAPGRSTVRLELPDPATGGTRVVYLKRYAGVPWRTQVRRTLARGSPVSFGWHEGRSVLCLTDIGIPSMRIVALGEELRRGGRDERSLILTEELAGATQADDYCEARFAGPLTQEQVDEKRRLVRQIADLARRLHAAHQSHRDFYLCHIMVRPVDGREPVLHLIDLQRLTHHRRGIGRRWVVKDLAALLFSSWPGPATGIRSPVFTQTDRVRFARAYFQTDRLGPAHKRLLRAVVRKARRIGRHDARRRARLGDRA